MVTESPPLTRFTSQRGRAPAASSTTRTLPASRPKRTCRKAPSRATARRGAFSTPKRSMTSRGGFSSSSTSKRPASPSRFRKTPPSRPRAAVTAVAEPCPSASSTRRETRFSVPGDGRDLGRGAGHGLGRCGHRGGRCGRAGRHPHHHGVLARQDLVAGGRLEADDDASHRAPVVAVLGGRHLAHAGPSHRQGLRDRRHVGRGEVHHQARWIVELEDRVARGARAADRDLHAARRVGHADGPDDVHRGCDARHVGRAARDDQRPGQGGEADEALREVRHRAIPRCAAKLLAAAAGWSGSCPGCRRLGWPTPEITTSPVARPPPPRRCGRCRSRGAGCNRRRWGPRPWPPGRRGR